MAKAPKSKSKSVRVSVKDQLPNPMTPGGVPLAHSDYRDDDYRKDGYRNSGYRSLPPIQIISGPEIATPTENGRLQVGLGWHPDGLDPRDMTPQSDILKEAMKPVKAGLLKSGTLPTDVVNIKYCSPIENQGSLGSCTAQAGVSLMEYEMRRRGVKHVDGSRLFVYKVTRKLLGWTGDTGAFIRDTIKAIAAFGVPPEKHWPYDITRYEEEPSSFLYAYGQNYKALNYIRLDPHGQPPKETLDTIQRVVANGYAIAFGFTVFDTISNAPDIPFPEDLLNARRRGGHAVLIIGYDDNHQAYNPQTDKWTTVPSFIIRNSWGVGWGLGGYGFLPYDYLLNGAAGDFWTVFNSSWIK